jgi:8-oxo-dGTP pyrophosphatase MutT (NUDIX family)
MAAFMPTSWVFPGGAVDASDADVFWLERCVGLSDEEASRRLAVPRAGLALFVAAIRECFEECGLLIAVDSAGRAVGDRVSARTAVRDTFAELCIANDLYLACGELAYVAHWITPEGLPKRFDTRFFIAPAPSGQVASLTSSEHTDLLWVRPGEALRGDRAPTLRIQDPTRAVLEEIAGFGDVDAIMAHARSRGTIPTIRPVLDG